MTKKKIIVGMSTLSEIRESNGIYIDKTIFIDYLENYAETKVPVLLRPRRFGKSLTASMLHSYYDISEKDYFEKNFKGTWIYDHRTPFASSYYVIHFDFSNVSSNASLVNDSFLRSVSYSINSFSTKYPEQGLPEKLRDISLYPSAADMLGTFLNNFSSKTKDGEYLYVIIDEYDHFANEILTRNKESFKSITSTSEGHERLIKRFYATLKKYYRGTGGCIDRFFITGVSSVSLDSVTSGFNIATNISSKKIFNEMIGFTHDELSQVIDETVDFSLLDDITKEQLIQIMEENYDGYSFNEDSREKLFNSNLCLAYLGSLISEQKLPNPNSISLNDDAGKLNGMLSLCEDDVRKEIVQAMFNKEPLVAELLHGHLFHLFPDSLMHLVVVVGILVGGPPDFAGGAFLAVLVVHDVLVLRGTAGVNAGHHVDGAEFGYVPFVETFETGLGLFVVKNLVRRVVEYFLHTLDAVLAEIDI